MRLCTWRAAVPCGVFLLACTGLGCTSDGVLPPSRGQVSVTVASNPTAIGTYAWATFTIIQIKFNPVNPIADDAQQDPLGLLPGALSVNLNRSAETVAASVPLTAQSYRVEPIEISTFELNVLPVAPVVAGGVCDAGVLQSLRPADSITVEPSCVFNVPPGGGVSVRLMVDGAGLADLLTSKFNCSTNVFTPPTEAELLTVIDFQCGP